MVWTRTHAHVALGVGLGWNALGSAAVLVGFLGRPFADAGDWRTYESAAWLLRSGHGPAIYDQATLGAYQTALGFDGVVPYPYPPAWLGVFWPFGLLAPDLGRFAWLVCGLGVTLGALILLARTLIPPSERRLFLLLALAAPVLGFAVYQEQATPCLLLATTLVARGLLRGDERQSGLSLAALLVKPQVAPVWLAYLLYRRRWRALAWFALGASAVGLTSLGLLGTAGLAAYARFLAGGPMLARGARETHSLYGLAFSLAGPGAAWPVYIGLSTLVLALALRQARSVDQPRRVLAVLSLSSLLVTPYLLAYDLALWLVPLALAWPEATRGRGRWLIVAGMLSPIIAMVLVRAGLPGTWLAPTVGVAALLALAAQPTKTANIRPLDALPPPPLVATRGLSEGSPRFQ